MSDSRWKDLYIFLKSKGFEVYSPGQKIGECESKYIVIKNDGSNAHTSFSTDVDLYSIMMYVPKDKYSELEKYKMEVKTAMKDIYPIFITNGIETSSFYDDSIKAHMISMQYKNYKMKIRKE